MHFIGLVTFLFYLCTVDSFSISGVSNFITVWNRLSASYSQITHSIDFEYDSEVAPVSFSNLISGASPVALTDISPSLFSNLKNATFKNLPFLAQPFTLIVNVPGLMTHFNISWSNYADMLLGKIVNWNHPDLWVRNPELAAKGISGPILHVLRTGSSSLTLAITAALSEYSSDWNSKYGQLLAWPSDLNVTYKTTTNQNFGTFAETFSIPFSISVGPFTFFDTIGYTVGIDYAGFFKSDTAPIFYPNDRDLILNSIDDSKWQLSDENYDLDYTSDWPLITMGYVILNNNTSNISCDDYLITLKFLRWVYTDDKAQSVIESGGFYLPSMSQVDEIVNYLDTVTCKGQLLLKVNTTDKFIVGRIIITTIFWVIVLVSIILLTKINYKKSVAKIYAIILTVGLLLCGASMILWTLEPISDMICHARWWLMGLGMVIFSGGVFCRSYQLKKIHQLVKSGRYQKSRNFDHIKLLITCMGLITLVELIILLVLQVTTPFFSVIDITDEVNRIGVYHCHNNVPYIWIGMHSGYLVCILLLGVYSMYSTWKISSSVDDTRINILMIFLCLVALCVADVMWGYDQSVTTDSWWALSLIIIWGFCMMCTVFVPKLVKAKKSSSTSMDSRKTAATGTSKS